MAFTKLTMTQNEFLENYLRGTNRSITSRQAEALYGIRNLRARVAELRSAGLQVYNDQTNDGRTAYVMSSRDVTGSRARVFA